MSGKAIKSEMNTHSARITEPVFPQHYHDKPGGKSTLYREVSIPPRVDGFVPAATVLAPSAQFRVVCWKSSSMDSRNLHLISPAQDIDACPHAVHPLLKRIMLGLA